MALHVVAAHIHAADRNRFQIEIIFFRLPVEENDVMLAAEELAGAAAGLIGPDDFIEEIVLAEDLVHQEAQARVHAEIDVKINHAGIAQKFFGSGDHFAHEGQIGLDVEVVLIRLHDQRAGTGFPLLLAHAHAHGKAVAGAEGRIEIDQLNLSRIFFCQGRQKLQHIAHAHFARRTCAALLLPPYVHPFQSHPYSLPKI